MLSFTNGCKISSLSFTNEEMDSQKSASLVRATQQGSHEALNVNSLVVETVQDTAGYGLILQNQREGW